MTPCGYEIMLCEAGLCFRCSICTAVIPYPSITHVKCKRYFMGRLILHHWVGFDDGRKVVSKLVEFDKELFEPLGPIALFGSPDAVNDLEHCVNADKEGQVVELRDFEIWVVLSGVPKDSAASVQYFLAVD